MNRVRLTGCLTEKHPMRYSPSGVAVFEGTLHYADTVMEAGKERKIVFDTPFKALGEVAIAIDALELGTVIEITGFFAPASVKVKKLSIHVTEFTIGV